MADRPISTRKTAPLSPAACLSSYKGDILRIWEKRARNEIRATHGQESSTLQNSLPLFLDQLIASLETQSPRLASAKDIAQTHAIQRSEFTDFDLEQVITEYNILRQIIFQFLDDAQIVPSPHERNIILDFIQNGKMAAAHRYTQLAIDQSRKSEERFRAQLDLSGTGISESEARARAEQAIHRLHDLMSITETALSRKTTLDDVLNRALEYVQHTFEADTVAIFLTDDSKEYLEVRAARGLEEEIVLKSKISKNKGVAGRIMAEEHSVIVDDLTNVEVASPVVKQKHLHCLMGAPLRTKQEVIGVIHVGRLKPKPFQQDEVEFLQIIADRLATSIDNATLYLRLQAKLQELRTERELRERFVATVAHDLRNPLSAAKLSTQLVLRYPERADARERQLAKIIHNLERADHLIQNLLDANRIRAGQRLPLEINECDLSQIAQEVCEEQSMIYGDRFVVDSPDIFPGYWSCSGMRRILENLVTNGVKYGAPNAPVITRLERQGDRALISVHNEGPPIPESEQKSLFEPFRRAKSAQEKGTPGWGLGLTLVRGLAEAHGGTVSIESSEAAGTTFKVDLPLDARPFQAA